MSQHIDYERFLYCIKWTEASYCNTTRRLTTDAMKVTGNKQSTEVSCRISSPLSVPDASWLLLLCVLAVGLSLVVNSASC